MRGRCGNSRWKVVHIPASKVRAKYGNKKCTQRLSISFDLHQSRSMRDFPSDFKRKAKALPAFPDVEVLAELALDLVRALICWTALESA